MQQTRLSRRWLVKIAIFLVASTGLGLWGLYDATLAYPARGRAHAEYMEYQYLMAMGQAGMPVIPIVDAEKALEDLRNRQAELERQRAEAEAQGQELQMMRSAAGLVMLQWLESLKVVGDLNNERVAIANPRERFTELNAKWQAKDQPKPLSGFDLPMQWGFVFLGFGLAAYLLLLVARVGSKKYRFDPETLTLTYPDGAKVAPGDIEDIDKRKWDKFIVQVKADGKWRKMDLLRYDPLEAWFLEMEKRTPFYEAPEAEEAEAAAEPAAAEASPEAERV